MKISRLFFLLIFLLCNQLVNAQVFLPYSITKSSIPFDTAKIAEPKISGGISPGMFSQNGFKPGQIVPDFILYDSTGKPCQLSLLLAEGKPVLLIAVSLTCPQSRSSVINPLRMINKAYGKKINIRLIYTIEAHPGAPDICPYTGTTFTMQNNVHDSILFLQPKTYQERKKMAESFGKKFPVKVPILIDSPDNDYWKIFGPAPNNAYLITPGGMVFKKYPWLEEAKQEVSRDIPALLSDTSFMKTDFSTDVWIAKSKTSSHTALFVANAKKYSIAVINPEGKTLLEKMDIETSECDLEKLPLKKGEYAVLIYKTDGHSYCLHYSRK